MRRTLIFMSLVLLLGTGGPPGGEPRRAWSSTSASPSWRHWGTITRPSARRVF